MPRRLADDVDSCPLWKWNHFVILHLAVEYLLEYSLVLAICRLLILNLSPNHLMRPASHQMLNEVVKDDRRHAPGIIGEEERR